MNAKAAGEFMFMLPAIQSVKDAYPDAEIILLAKPWHKEFFDGRPGPINRTVVMPPMPGLVLPGETFASSDEVEAFFPTMQAERFDVALQLHGPGEHANPVVARLGAALTVGCHGETALRLDRSLPHIGTQHEVFRWLEVVEQIGVHATCWEPSVRVTKEDEGLAAAALASTNGPLVVLSVGAVHPRRRWAATGFAHIADALVEHGLQIVIVGSADDAPIARSTQEAMQRPGIDLTGKLGIRALAGVLARSRLVIGNDSDALRLAWAFDVATVGIYWSGTLLNIDPLRRRRHRRVISWQTTCPACGVNLITSRCSHDDSMVAEVPEAEVLQHALALLEAG